MLGEGARNTMADVHRVWVDRIRAERKKRGWDKPEMARQLALAAGEARSSLPSHESLLSYVKRWERGAVDSISERYRLLYARAFGISEEDLFAEDEGDVNRREFVGSSLVAGLTLRLPSMAGSTSSTAAGRPIGRAPADVEGVVAGVRGALFEPTAGRASTSGVPKSGTLGQRAMRAWELRQAAEYAALGALLAGLLADTRCAVECVDDESQQVAATRAYVHAHNAASSLTKSTAPELAAVAADRALQAARKVEDELLVGAATLRLANVFLASGRYRQAVDTAADGANALTTLMSAGPAVPATWGALLLTAAIGAANLGEGPAAAWEFLGQARTAAAILQDDHAGLHAVFGPQNIAIHGVQIATALGDPREALRRADTVDVGRLPSSLLERRSTLLIDIARCHYLIGEHRDALAALLEADRLAPEEVCYSTPAHELAAGLLRTSAAREPGLRTLIERIHVQA